MDEASVAINPTPREIRRWRIFTPVIPTGMTFRAYDAHVDPAGTLLLMEDADTWQFTRAWAKGAWTRIERVG